MLSFGNDELTVKSELGKTITCQKCGELHDIQYGQEQQPDGTWKESKLLAFYICGEKAYLAGVDGKNIMDRFK